MAAPLRMTRKCRERDLADLERVLHRVRKEDRPDRSLITDHLVMAIHFLKKRLRAGRGAKPGRRAVR